MMLRQDALSIRARVTHLTTCHINVWDELRTEKGIATTLQGAWGESKVFGGVLIKPVV